MYIEKSFQLLSAESGKVANDDARRSGDDDAEFSEFFGAELDQQQRRATGNQHGTEGGAKTAGQEVAALAMKQAGHANTFTPEQVGNTQRTIVQAAANTLHGTANTDENAATLLLATQEQMMATQEQSAIDETQQTDIDTESDAISIPNELLSIIGQSQDFNSILAKPSYSFALATSTDTPLTSAETLAAEVLGLSMTEQAISEPVTGEQAAAAIGQVAAATVPAESQRQMGDKTLPKAELGAEQSLAAGGKNSPSDTALSLTDDQQQKIAQPAVDTATTDTDAAQAHSTTLEKLSAKQGMASDQQIADKSHPQRASDNDVPIDVADSKSLIQPNSGSVTASGQTPQFTVTADMVAAQQGQTENKAGKSSDTTPIHVELPIEVSPDFKIFGNPNPVATAGVSASPKNATQSFAQFQKSANAAAVLAQKQQLQAEQTQSQPLQELATQQPQKFAELNQMLPGQNTDSHAAFASLLPTERPVAGSAAFSGSSGGQQQQHTASPLFAARLNDTLTSEQPALNLLEPNAASQLKERVMFQVNQKIHSAEIKLAPEELGSMQIKVQLQQEQLSVQFVVQQAGAKEALEQQMPRLREMLQEQGIELTEGQVSQQREGADEQRQARERNQSVGHGADREDEPMMQQAVVRVSDRMVDYYA